ncbi:pyridoxal-phosphate dependent enzyme [Kitasatospora acidiphila]|uniref:Pyridoxal-phosphate dependent enzyme n=1 Tax=Kitasatospora acidiphila TaxID=2567942 RepID=A0A540WE06_9ACTN|nr:pyridoxal-phosphate dependent enzyme [Kitasatospora acidiphila]
MSHCRRVAGRPGRRCPTGPPRPWCSVSKPHRSALLGEGPGTLQHVRAPLPPPLPDEFGSERLGERHVHRPHRRLLDRPDRQRRTAQQVVGPLGDAGVQLVTEPDPVSGLLGARLAYVRQLCDSDPRYLWLNQYGNPNNWRAHHRRTAPRIAEQFPELDVPFVGAGTTGTLVGCARWFKEHRPQVRTVAVDSVGSVIFGGEPARRLIPGLGSGVRPPMLDESFVDDILLVPEPDTVRACHRLADQGFLFGGSTGTVVAGAQVWFAERPRGGSSSSVPPGS